MIFAPTCFASCMAATRFGDTFFSRLPPPTERMKRQSRLLSLPVRSHSTNTLAHPSSFVRAVSSETLSVGAYASIPVIFLKSLTAWDAFAALPPTPSRNSLPPCSLTARSSATHFSQSAGLILATISAVSLRCCAEYDMLFMVEEDATDAGRQEPPVARAR